MEAVRHLHGLGGATRGAFRETAAPVAAHHGHARPLLEPSSQGVRLAIRQEIEHAVVFQVDEDRTKDRTVALPTPESPVVDADDVWGGDHRQRESVYLAHLTQQCIRAGADAESEGIEQTRSRFTA